jgi:hypothetical protein
MLPFAGGLFEFLQIKNGGVGGTSERSIDNLTQQ